VSSLRQTAWAEGESEGLLPSLPGAPLAGGATSRGRDDGLRAILEAAAAAQKTATVAQEIAARLCQEALAELEER
jgi:hypothetical protein